MNRVQVGKALKCVLLFLCLHQVGSSQPATKNSYQLIHSMTYDGKNVSLGKAELFIVDSLAFEGLYTNVGRSTRNLQPNGQFVVDKSTVVNKDSLTNYVVTDFKSKRCYVFSPGNSPRLLQTAPLSAKDKITGILFNDEAYAALGNNAKNFRHIADTTIGNFKYQILENTVGFTVENIPYHRARAFLNTDLQKFPFHPISTQIDNEFSGFVTRIELYGSDGKAFITNYTVEAIPKEKVAFINRYLKLLPL